MDCARPDAPFQSIEGYCRIGDADFLVYGRPQGWRRPIAVAIGSVGESTAHHERATISWFGIRGIGSVFYLLFAIDRGMMGAESQQLITITLLTVAASIVAHGVSVRPLMRWYKRRKSLAL